MLFCRIFPSFKSIYQFDNRFKMPPFLIVSLIFSNTHRGPFTNDSARCIIRKHLGAFRRLNLFLRP